MSEQNLEINSELADQHKPKFDGGSFTIDHLSPSPNGFEVVTDKSSRRRNSTPQGREPLPFTQEQLATLKNAIPGQMKYAKGNDAQDTLKKLRSAQSNDTSKETREEAYIQHEEKRRLYQERMTPHVGITSVQQEANTLFIDIKPADYPVYRTFAKPSLPPEVVEYASAMTGTDIVIVTKDQRVILQNRSDRNTPYGGILGVSAAGYLQGRMYHPTPEEQPTQERIGTLVPINTEYVKANILREMKEEIGLDEKYLDTVRITGFVKDKVQPHNGILLFGTTSLSAEQVRAEAQKASRNLQLSDVEFMEKFIDIPATPEAISILVTQIKCPFPPDQYGAVILAGYNMVLEQKGRDTADNWIRDLEPKVKQNYQEINSIVAQYYEKHPAVLAHIPQGRPPRNPKGYEPSYLPSEQGLPDVMSELKRVGLIS